MMDREELRIRLNKYVAGNRRTIGDIADELGIARPTLHILLKRTDWLNVHAETLSKVDEFLRTNEQ